MLENRDFIKLTCKDLRKDLDILFKTFSFTYDNVEKEEEIWDGAVVHIINEIPREEFDAKYEPRYLGSICRIRSKMEKEEIVKKIREENPNSTFIDFVKMEFIDVYKIRFWRLLVWKVWDYHQSKFFDIKTFYSKNYEIYMSGGEPTEEELWHGWSGEPSYVYNFAIGIDESFTIMEEKKAQEFLNKLIKEYDWFWYIE